MKTQEMYCRGKRIDCDVWEYGYLVSDIYGAKFPIIVHSSEYNDGNNVDIDYSFVRDETVGQYTGLVDRNNIKIFEGDIVKGGWGVIFTVFRDKDYLQFRARAQDGTEHSVDYYHGHDGFEVIGNIYDNPELLEEQW